MLLNRSNSLLGLAVAVLVAGVAGVTLGQSAIGAINPVYFQGAVPPPRAVDGRERQPAQPDYYQAYNWEDGASARAIACGDNCGPPVPYEAFDYAGEAPPPRLARAEWRDQTATVELAPWPPGQVGRERIAATRHADDPVEAKPDDTTDGKDEPPADDPLGDVNEE